MFEKCCQFEHYVICVKILHTNQETNLISLPLCSRHHLGHGGHEVFGCDCDRINIKQQFLG